MTFDELLAMPLGTLIREPFGNRRLWHLRGVVDGRAVIRTWHREKSRWYYAIEGSTWWLAYGGSLKVERARSDPARIDE